MFLPYVEMFVHIVELFLPYVKLFLSYVEMFVQIMELFLPYVEMFVLIVKMFLPSLKLFLSKMDCLSSLEIFLSILELFVPLFSGMFVHSWEVLWFSLMCGMFVREEHFYEARNVCPKLILKDLRVRTHTTGNCRCAIEETVIKT